MYQPFITLLLSTCTCIMVLKLPIYLHGSQVTNVPPAVLLRKKPKVI